MDQSRFMREWNKWLEVTQETYGYDYREERLELFLAWVAHRDMERQERILDRLTDNLGAVARILEMR